MDVAKIRAQFPILRVRVPSKKNGTNPLRYFDHAASTHPPQAVIDAVVETATAGYANVHRGNYHLSRLATDAFELARLQLLNFIGGSPQEDQILFSQNTTSALDLASHIMSRAPGDIVITHMEHHSNDLPHRRRGRVHRVDPNGNIKALPALIEDVLRENQVKLVAVTGASNVTGEAPDVHAIARVAHEYGAKILVDAAQLFAHRPLDVHASSRATHLDFVAAAGHKAYAPFGSSMLYGPKELLDDAPPVMPGGGTVVFVDREAAHFRASPDRHEGGTPNVIGAVAFAAASRWLERIGRGEIAEHEKRLVKLARTLFAKVQGLTVYKVGGAPDQLGVFPHNLSGWHYSVLAQALDDGWGIACRDGCFCAHPLMVDLLGVTDLQGVQDHMLAGRQDLVPGMVRASLGVYNHEEDVRVLGEALATLSTKRPSARSRAVPVTAH